MSQENRSEDTLPSAAEVAARRAEALAAQGAARSQDVDGKPFSAAETPAETREEVLDDPYAPFRDLPAPSEQELLELRRAAAEAEKYLDALKRTKADYANFQNRVSREREQIRLFARREVMTELLDVIDKFLLSMRKSGEDEAPSSFSEAMKLVESELSAFMDRVGLSRIDTEGAAFNPDLHAAILQMESDEVPEGKIVDEVRAGYRLGDHVLRPCQVVVSKGPAKPPTSARDARDDSGAN